MAARSEVRERLRKQREREQKKQQAQVLALRIGIGVVILAFIAAIAIAVNISEKNEPTPTDYKLGNQEASIEVSDEPYLQFGAESGEPVVDVYLDFVCPYCGKFHEVSGATLEDLARDGDVTLRVHPRHFLAASSSTDYSTRAAIAFVAVYQDDPGAALDYMDALFYDEPNEGSKGHTNQKLQKIAEESGSSVDVVSAIEEGRGLDWLNDTVEVEAQANTKGTPYVTVDGTPIDEWPSKESLTTAIEEAR